MTVGSHLPDDETWRFEGDGIDFRQDDRNWFPFGRRHYVGALERTAERG